MSVQTHRKGWFSYLEEATAGLPLAPGHSAIMSPDLLPSAAEFAGVPASDCCAAADAATPAPALGLPAVAAVLPSITENTLSQIRNQAFTVKM